MNKKDKTKTTKLEKVIKLKIINHIKKQQEKKLQSEDRKKYLHGIRKNKILILTTQILIVVGIVAIWEILADNGIIDSFIMSSPSRILKTFINLAQNNLLEHIKITCIETIIGFSLGTLLGSIIAIILWWSNFISKVSEPFLVVLNSLPKVALRTNNNYLGRGRNASNNNNGTSNFTNS